MTRSSPADPLGWCKDDRTRLWLELVGLESGTLSIREWVGGEWVDKTAAIIERNRARLVELNVLLQGHQEH
ncbi:MAG TPA: hypothetical protein VKZ79_22785 [Alphaproteobacteria bacterium]|nr:hypothetical protein [Alphaproteobacteria bacterium]